MHNLLTDIIQLSDIQIMELSNISMDLTLLTLANGDHETAKINHLFNDLLYFAYRKEWAKAQETIETILKGTQ